jgi:fluoride ion exporter CrcB/FEX
MFITFTQFIAAILCFLMNSGIMLTSWRRSTHGWLYLQVHFSFCQGSTTYSSASYDKCYLYNNFVVRLHIYIYGGDTISFFISFFSLSFRCQLFDVQITYLASYFISWPISLILIVLSFYYIPLDFRPFILSCHPLDFFLCLTCADLQFTIEGEIWYAIHFSKFKDYHYKLC